MPPLPLIRNKWVPLGTSYNWPASFVDGPTSVSDEVTERHSAIVDQFSGKMDSLNHERDMSGKFSTGGPWTMHKFTNTIVPSKPRRYYREFFPGKMYDGSLVIQGHVGGYPFMERSELEVIELKRYLAEIGGDLYKRMQPDKPEFAAATALGELREGLPIKKDSIRDFREVIRSHRKYDSHVARLGKRMGEFHLSVEFGWIPLLSDFCDYIDAFSTQMGRLEQLIKDEGKPIRRSSRPNKYQIEESYNLSSHHAGGVMTSPLFVTQAYNGQEGVETRVSHSRQVWAEAQYRFYLPGGPRTEGWKRNLLSKLRGEYITPSMVWNLTPWSWMVDYFVDVGQFMDSISPGVTDELICDYFYVMCTDEHVAHSHSRTPLCSRPYPPQNGEGIAVSELRTVDSIKLRVEGTPYGFGANDSLSPKQLAILDALALAKLF